MNTRILFAIGALALPATLLAGEQIDNRISAPANGTVEIENMVGSITVSGWDRDEVRLEGELDAQAEELVFENDGNFTTIKVKYPGRRGGMGDGHHYEGSDLRVTLPLASKLIVSSISANVDVSETSGPLRVETISGSMDVATSSQEIRLETISGSIRLEEAGEGARAVIQTISGSSRITGFSGEVEGSSVSGGIDLSRSELSRAEIVNTSGDINVEAEFAAGGVYRFKSISGDIAVTFENEPNADFDVSTFSGDIDNDFGPEPKKVSRYTPNQELKFTAGEGDGEVRIGTMSGDIDIRQ